MFADEDIFTEVIDLFGFRSDPDFTKAKVKSYFESWDWIYYQYEKARRPLDESMPTARAPTLEELDRRRPLGYVSPPFQINFPPDIKELYPLTLPDDLKTFLFVQGIYPKDASKKIQHFSTPKSTYIEYEEIVEIIPYLNQVPQLLKEPYNFYAMGSGAHGIVLRDMHQKRAYKVAEDVTHEKDILKNLAIKYEKTKNVVNLIYDSRYNDNKNILALEYVTGPTLSHYLHIDHKIFTPEETRRVMLQVLNGLQEMLELGYYHSDLHPGNIVVSDENSVIIDLGRANKIGEKGDTSSTFARCYGYDDLASLGYMAYEMLTGRHAFNESGDSNLTSNLKKQIKHQRLHFREKYHVKLSKFTSPFANILKFCEDQTGQDKDYRQLEEMLHVTHI